MKERAVNLKGSKTEKNLKDAFAGESQANRRYLYFAAKADVEGYNDVSTVFRSTAEGETGHAHGHLEYLETVGDPATGLPIGETKTNSEGRHRRRDARVQRHVSGHGEAGARGRLLRDRRLVRDAGQGRALARQPLPEGPRRDLIAPRRVSAGDTGIREGSLQAPSRHPLDWRSAEFIDEAALEKELERVFDICHGCRRCFSLCNSFPTLFDAIDASADARARWRRQEGLLGRRRSLLPV